MKKPAAGAARIQIFYSSPPPSKAQKTRQGGGSVAVTGDSFLLKKLQFHDAIISTSILARLLYLAPAQHRKLIPLSRSI